MEWIFAIRDRVVAVEGYEPAFVAENDFCDMASILVVPWRAGKKSCAFVGPKRRELERAWLLGRNGPLLPDLANGSRTCCSGAERSMGSCRLFILGSSIIFVWTSRDFAVGRTSASSQPIN